MAAGNPGPTLGTATIRVIANTTEFDYRLRRSFKHLTASAVAAGSVLLGMNFLGNSVKEAVKLEAIMNRIRTIMDSPADENFLNTDNIRKVSNELGISAEKVADAAYDVLSSGVAAKDALAAVTAAGKTAISTNSDLKVVTDAVTSALNAYGDKGMTAAKASDVMFRSLQFGKGSMREFASYVSNAIPIASQLGVSFEQLNGLAAASTLTGKKARVVFTGMKVAMQELNDESKGAGKTFKDLFGTNFRDYVGKTGDLMGAFLSLADTLGPRITSFFGAKEGAQAIQQLALLNRKQLRNIVKETVNSEGSVEKAFGKVSKGIAQQTEILKARWNNLKSELGETLLPLVNVFTAVLSSMLTYIQPWFQAVGEFFNTYVTPNVEQIKSAIEGVGNAIETFAKNVWNYLQPIRTALSDALVANGPAIQAFLQQLGGALAAWAGVIQTYVLPVVSLLATTLLTLVQYVGPVLLQGLTLSAQAIGLLADNFTDLLIALSPLIVAGGIPLLVGRLGALAAAAKYAGFFLKYHVVVAVLAVRAAMVRAITVAAVFWVTLLGPVGAIIAAFVAVAGAFAYAMFKFEKFREAVWTGINLVGRAIWEVLTATVNIFLAFVDALVSGAAKAFGWVPGIGGKLKAANREFDAFAAGVNASMNSIDKHFDITYSVKEGAPAGEDSFEKMKRLWREQQYGTGTGAMDKMIADRKKAIEASAGSNLPTFSGGKILSANDLGGAADSAASQAASALERAFDIFTELTKNTGKKSIQDIKRGFKDLFEQLKEAGKSGLIDPLKEYRERLLNLAKRRDNFTEQLTSARDRLKELRDEAKSFRSNVIGVVRDMADVSQESKGIATTFSGIQTQLQYTIDRTRAFTSFIQQLRELNLNKTALRQLMEAGPEQGFDAARAIVMSGQAGVDELNGLNKELASAGKSLAKTGYDTFYKNGINIAEGLVAGLNAKENKLQLKMTNIGKKMAQAFKDELGINSPSKVGEWMGSMFPEGVVKGLDKGTVDVQRASRKLGQQVTFGPGAVQVNGVSDPRAAQRAGILAGKQIAGVLASTQTESVLNGVG